MQKRGKPYIVKVEGIEQKRRAVYTLSDTPSPEQVKMIEKMEYGLQHDWENVGDAYHFMRQVEYKGIDVDEERQGADGKWYKVVSEDADLTLMQKGAL